MTHCIPLIHTFSQFLICCSDCSLHVVDISINRIMRSIVANGNVSSICHHPHSSLTAVIMNNGDLAFYDRGLNMIPLSTGVIETKKSASVPLGDWLSRSTLGGGKPSLLKWGRLMEGADSSSLFICYEMGPVVMIKLEYSFLIGNLKTSSLLNYYLDAQDIEKVKEHDRSTMY